jgi:hypothetical protein
METSLRGVPSHLGRRSNLFALGMRKVQPPQPGEEAGAQRSLPRSGPFGKAAQLWQGNAQTILTTNKKLTPKNFYLYPMK